MFIRAEHSARGEAVDRRGRGQAVHRGIREYQRGGDLKRVQGESEINPAGG